MDILPCQMGVGKEVKMFEFINLMKAIASCLVANSHFDGIWPITALATGGSIGNCLFFSASGFLLAHIKQSFFPWYLKKLIRIYPAVWITTTLSLLWRNNITAGVLASEYLLLRHYWFLQALVVLYIPFYFIMKGKLRDHLPISFATLPLRIFTPGLSKMGRDSSGYSILVFF